MTATRTLAVFVAILAAAGPAAAQAERYELGRRLRAYEAAWELAHPDARVKSYAELPKVTAQFFGLKLGEAGRTLDQARRVLNNANVPAPVAWAESLFLDPEARLIDAARPGLTVAVKSFYAVKGGAPDGATCRVTLGDGTPVVSDLAKLPAKLTVPLPKVAGGGADNFLTLEVLANGVVLSHCRVTVSVVPDLAARLAVLPKLDAATIEAATLRDRAESLRRLADGSAFDTDIPAAELLAEAEAMAKLPADGSYFAAVRAGQFRLSVPIKLGSGKFTTAPLRLLVPARLDAAKPVPLVVALHGAGGSEDLYFEGYGAGRIVAECEKRGWLLVAPRGGLFGAPAVEEIVAALAAHYPIDPKRVFLVGHSMGAGQVAELAQRSPGKYRGLGLLGGAARVRDAKAFADLPLFLAVGTKDPLALTGMRTLNKTLTAGGATRLTYREYPEAEHLVIVREALPDLFEQWDALKAE